MWESKRQNASEITNQSPDRLVTSPRRQLQSTIENRSPRHQIEASILCWPEAIATSPTVSSPVGEEVNEEIIRPIQRSKKGTMSSGYCIYSQLDRHKDIEDRQSSPTRKNQYYPRLDEVREMRKDASIRTVPEGSISEIDSPSPLSYLAAQQLRNAGVKTLKHGSAIMYPTSRTSEPQDNAHTSYEQSHGSQIMNTPLLLVPNYQQQGLPGIKMVPVKTVDVHMGRPGNENNEMLQLNDPNVPFVVPSIPDHQLTPPPLHSVHVPVSNAHVSYEELTGEVPPDDDVHMWVDSQNRMFTPVIQHHAQLQSEPDFSVPPFPGYNLPGSTPTHRKSNYGRPQGTSDSGICSNPSSRGLCICFKLNLLIN